MKFAVEYKTDRKQDTDVHNRSMKSGSESSKYSRNNYE